MNGNKQDEARRKRLRRSLQAASAEVPVSGDDLRWLLDEVSRLQQSNDRLRRQNRRLRIRSGEDDSVADALPDASAPEAGNPES